jgi:UDP-GlcNAc:undecaprenyl-phosphate GlcNAc-1-phosphate transferase
MVLVLAALLGAMGLGMASMFRALTLAGDLKALRTANYRGREVMAAGGVVLFLTALAAEAVLSIISRARPVPLTDDLDPFSPSVVPLTFLSSDNLGVLLLAAGFFALGLYDDITSGHGGESGFGGHVRALLQGRLTPGMVKAGGGLLLTLTVAALWEFRIADMLLDALILALAANFFNLLDLRPGRAIKVFFVTWIPLAILSWQTPYLPISTVFAAGAGAWLPADLREEGMLGDSGANMLGAVVGAGVVLSMSFTPRLVVLGVLTAITLVSERWSLTAIIDRVPPLRWVDGLGRLP